MDKTIILLANIDQKAAKIIESINEKSIEFVYYTPDIEFEEFLQNQRFDIIIICIDKIELTCMSSLDSFKKRFPNIIIPIIVITDQHEIIPKIVKTLDEFTIDIIVHPVVPEILTMKIQFLLEHLRLESSLKHKIHTLSELNLKYKKIQNQVKSIAYHDYLTSIPNRRYLDLELSKQVRYCYRNHNPISILMIDLDNFKGYNDYYGHVEGDKVLQQVAEVINEKCQRPLDFAARYGGEEFVVILPNTEDIGAFKIAEHIRKSIYKLEIDHCPKCVFEYVSVSIGIYSTIPNSIQNIEKLISNSDQAMYQAKQLGKNQSTIYK